MSKEREQLALNTGATLPGTAAAPVLGNYPWALINNIKTIGSGSASCSIDGESTISGDTDFIYTSNYGFSIPTGAAIKGVIARLIGSTDGTQDGGSPMDLYSFATVFLNDVSRGPNTPGFPNTAIGLAKLPLITGEVESLGSATDLWSTGTTLTPSFINSSNFGAMFSSADPGADIYPYNLSIDYISLDIYYAVGGQVMHQLGYGPWWLKRSKQTINLFATVSHKSGFYSLNAQSFCQLLAFSLVKLKLVPNGC